MNFVQLGYINAMKEKMDKIRVATQSKNNSLKEYGDELLRCINFGDSGKNSKKTPVKQKRGKKGGGTQLNDDMQKLEDFSIFTAGARYELLNTNKMLFEMDMDMKV